MIVPDADVKVFAGLITTELKKTTPGEVIEIAVAPSNVVVLFPVFRIPVTERFPATVYAALGTRVVPALMVMSLNLFVPVPLSVVVPALPKTVVADDVKFPVAVNVVPVTVTFEFTVKDLPAVTVTLLNATVPDPALVRIVVPPKVVVLLPAASVPAPLRLRLPVIV